jgi:NAD(P)-dependent dehydrogenase (short-subunit alcohol dehydrogenase family)
MDLELKGEFAIVTGSAQGMGRAIARAFAEEGATVALIDVAPSVVEVAAEISTRAGVDALAFPLDVTDFKALKGVADGLRRQFGRVDHVVHAAAIGSGKFGFPFWNLEPGDWDRVLRVNLLGAVNIAHAFAPGMAKAKRGTLLFLASVAGQIGSPTDPPYSASKAALINFMQCAARDLATYGVRANALSPGMVQTALNRSVWAAWNARQPKAERQTYEAWTAEKIERVIPLNRWQEAEDVASMAVFLASKKAKNITGQTLNVDGGWVMHS